MRSGMTWHKFLCGGGKEYKLEIAEQLCYS